MATNNQNNIFRYNKLKFNELYNDALNFIKKTYQNLGQQFTMASSFGQLLQVVLNLGRMILFYIEFALTESNIKTATLPSSIKGLATLTGHNPSRPIAARGKLRLNVINNDNDYLGQTILIQNYTTLVNSLNGLTYTIILPAENAKLTLNTNNYIDVNVMQGIIQYQQATGSGEALQSYNFATKKGDGIDNFFVNVYVNGEKWNNRDSILDMAFQEKSCIVKTGESGGIDIFFGNGYNGRVPDQGSTILIEYLITEGRLGNLNAIETNTGQYWSFKNNAYTINSESIDLNKVVNVVALNDIIFGVEEESLYLTKMLSPNMSRSFVLANNTNYEYFLRKLNMFSIIDTIKGFNTYEDSYALNEYNKALDSYNLAKKNYLTAVNKYGSNAAQTIELLDIVNNAKIELDYKERLLNEQQLDDNTVYLFLIPDIKNRINTGDNYFTTSDDSFKLSESEKLGILNLIEESGQRIMTIDNVIINPLYPKFAINISILMWEDYIFDNVYNDIVTNVSNYFINNTRRDRIPVSDLIKVIENTDGVDSVSVWFDADKDNIKYYSNSYGIDEYGDIILERYVTDSFGNIISVKDLYPLIRGGFTNKDGIEYDSGLTKDTLSAINVMLRGVTPKNYSSINTANITSK